MDRQTSAERHDGNNQPTMGEPLRRRKRPSERIVREHPDDISRVFFNDPVVVADAFNYLLYSGRPVISPDSLKPLDPAEIFLPAMDGLPLEQKQKSASFSRDSVKLLSCMAGERASYAILGIEGQVYCDLGMVVRSCTYDALRYAAQRRELIQRNRERKAFSQKGYAKYAMGGLLPADRLHPVVTLVVYLSDTPWEGARTLHELLSFPDASIKAFVPDYRLALLEPGKMPDKELLKFGSDLRGILFGAKYAHDIDALERHLPQFGDMLQWRTLPLLNRVTHCRFQLKDKTKDEDNSKYSKSEESMQGPVRTINVWQCALNQGIEKGLKEGRKEGLKEGRKEGLKEGRKEGHKEGRMEGHKEGHKEGAVDGTIRVLLKLGLDYDRIREIVTETLHADAHYVMERMALQDLHQS